MESMQNYVKGKLLKLYELIIALRLNLAFGEQSSETENRSAC